MKLSDNFDSQEFRCRGPECHGVEPLVDRELVENLEKLRGLLNADLAPGAKPHVLIISSGARCFTHNATKEVGGKPSSQHLYNLITGQGCRAADVYSPTRSVREVYEAALTIPEFKGVGLAPPVKPDFAKAIRGRRGYVHVDVRDAVARAQWGYDAAGRTTSLAQVLPWLDLERGERV